MKFDKKKKYIAAVSGGPDSMALLDKYHKNIICVCHVNYHKRADSYRDTEIVVKYCKRKHLKLKVLDVKKSQYKKIKINNFQALARKIRYDFFLKCSKECKCKNILMGHNLNDFLETSLMQKKRKSLNFYYGIKPISSYKSLIIYRPLINEFKADLEKYCKKQNIAYAIDSTNALDLYERNRVRKQLNKKTRKQSLKLYKEIQLRNKKQSVVEKRTTKELDLWKKTKYKLKVFKRIKNPEKVIYLFLKQNEIENINHNKINLIKQFLFSQKSNCKLRLGNGIWLLKKSGGACIFQDKLSKH